MPSQNDVMTALSKVMDPELGRNLVDLNMVRQLNIAKNGKIAFTMALTVPSCPLRNKMADEARAILLTLPGVTAVEIEFGTMTEEERRAVLGRGTPELPKLNQFNKVKQVIAVMSGKGGVGKSSVTAMLATGLARKGLKVGILDADITGPSIPKLFGLPAGGLRGGDMGMLPAVTGLGIKVVSTNLLVKDEETAVVWRGPMIAGAITQFWTQALWGKLDYLLVDMPPGTSDAALTVLQTLPLNGIVLVTTPQDLAALVVRKAINMIHQLKIPIVGIVENMSYFRCPDTGSLHAIFGPSHVEEIAAYASVPVSARLPIDPQVATLSDAGKVEEVNLAEMAQLVDQILEPIKQ